MAKGTTIQFRIDTDLKDEVFAIFQGMGLTPSEAVRAFFEHVQKTHTLPWDPPKKWAFLRHHVIAQAGVQAQVSR